MVFQPHQPCQTTLGWIGAWSAIPFPLIPHLSIFSQHLSTVSYTILHSLVMSYHVWSLCTTGVDTLVFVYVRCCQFFHVVSLPLSLSLHLWRRKPGSSQLLTSNVKQHQTSHASSHRTKSHVSCVWRHDVTIKYYQQIVWSWSATIRYKSCHSRRVKVVTQEALFVSQSVHRL